MKKKKKALTAVLAVLLVLCIGGGIAVFAAIRKPEEAFSAGTPWERLYVNRINISLNATDFTYVYTDPDTFVMRFTVTLEKPEKDFYVQLDSLRMENLNCRYIRMKAATENGTAVKPEGVLLPSDTSGTHPLSWTVEAVFSSASYDPESEPAFVVSYTSGISYELRESYQTAIPLQLHFLHLGRLPTVIRDARTLVGQSSVYTRESRRALENKLNAIEQALTEPEGIDGNQINAWIEEINLLVESLELR